MPLKSRLFRALPLALLLALSVGPASSSAANDGVGVGEGSGGDDDDLGNGDEASEEAAGGAELSRANNIAERGSSSSSSSAASFLADPSLGPDSVVLITGAAGFLGSELALALRRTYGVKKLLLVDNLGMDSENESAYVPPGKNDGDGGRTEIYDRYSEEEMSSFEIRRQRAFRIFHELTAASLDEDVEGGAREDFRRRTRNDAESIRFYRADMRPSIPEFFDFGEVPLLEGAFMSHPDITHVVHLADVPLSAQNQAIPRNKDSVKTGRMEGILEEFRLILERAAAASSDGNGGDGARLPQFVYASSHEVYDAISAADKVEQPNPPPFREDKPITTPSSLHGTAKLIDEVLASAYHSTHGIYSVGLRFFPVYGPWDAPGTEVFDLAERAMALNDGSAVSEDEAYDGDVKDYVYVDDAIDAIMSAMQYRPPGSDPPPVVFNVGTGRGSTLAEAREELTRHFPKLSQQAAANQRSAKANGNHAERRPTRSVASTSRSESLLGFKAQVSLSEGLARTLTWHRDRAFPYGRDPHKGESAEQRKDDAAVARSLAATGGEEGCSPLDRECLRGAPVFPCASECRRPERCTPSAWDDVERLARAVTSGCDAVLYTILLEEGAEGIPSATTAAGADASPYVGADLPEEDAGRRTRARCNVAFVSDGSPLVRRLRSEGEEYLDEGDGGGAGLPPLLRHGFWTVLPVSAPSRVASSKSSWMHAFDGAFALEYLPKVSPGRFFGSSVRYAVYAAPSVLVEDLPGLLRRMEDAPPSTGGGSPPESARAAVMLAEERPACDPARRGSACASTWTRPARNDALQTSAYNMIRVALRGDMLGGGLNPVLDPSLLVHSLREEDSRLFRCDVYGEAAQWGASSDGPALEFIVSLHDLWSRAVSYWTGGTVWWNGEDAPAKKGEGDAGEEDAAEKERRRLAESDVDEKERRGGKWMGILSATEVQLFTRILPSEGAGIIHLDDNRR